MARIIQRIAGRVDRSAGQSRNRLDSKAARSHKDMLGPFRNHILQLLLCLGTVAQEIDSRGARNLFSLLGDKLLELTALWFVNGFKFLEALVAGNDEQIVFIGQ